MIKVEVAKASDLWAFIPRPIFHGEIPFIAELVEYVERKDCVSHTLSLDGLPFALIGAVPFPGSILCVWAWFGDGIKKRPIEFCKISRRAVKSYIAAFSPKEVYMLVKKGFEDALKYSTFLGFKVVEEIVGIDGTSYYKMQRVV